MSLVFLFYVQGMEYRTLQMLGKPFITLNIHIKTFSCFVETDTDVGELLWGCWEPNPLEEQPVFSSADPSLSSSSFYFLLGDRVLPSYPRWAWVLRLTMNFAAFCPRLLSSWEFRSSTLGLALSAPFSRIPDPTPPPPTLCWNYRCAPLHPNWFSSSSPFAALPGLELAIRLG